MCFVHLEVLVLTSLMAECVLKMGHFIHDLFIIIIKQIFLKAEDFCFCSTNASL